LLNGGGTDDQCIKLVHGLQQLGADARLAGPDGRQLCSVVRNLGVRFEPLPSEGPAKIRLILASAKLIRRHGVQVVHGHHGRDLWATVFAARLSGRKPKVVLTRHMAKSPSSWFSRQFLLNRCDAIIAVSQFVVTVLREGVYEPNSPEPERRERPPLHGDHSKIHVIYGGIDTGKFRPLDATAQRRAWGLEPDHFAFGVVGGYELPRGKGQREFLRAAASISQRVPNARFLIIGRGNMRELLERDIAELGLQGKAILTPYSHEVPAAMNALDCLVHPQIGTEAFAAVVVEAFACGTPVIASALDGIPEAFAMGGEGQLVAPEQVPELAQAMLERVKRGKFADERRRELHRKVADKCSIQKTSRATLDLYLSL
jgi:glycosyltransferase involved in cell wall biosynthesis